MDQTFVAKIKAVTPENQAVFSIGNNTTFSQDGDDLLVRYTADSGAVVEHKLLGIDELLEGDAVFVSTDEDWQDRYLPLLMGIEAAIDRVYSRNPGLKDKTVIVVLDRLITKPSILIRDELIQAVQSNIRLILSTERYSRNELLGCLRKVQRSVKRHHSVDGPVGYLEFIKGKI